MTTKQNIFDDENGIIRRLSRYSIAKKSLTILLTIAPFAAVPFLYFLGRLYNFSYFGELGVPIGVLDNEFTETLLTGFIFGVTVSVIELMKILGEYMYYLYAAFLLIFIIIVTPVCSRYLDKILIYPIVKMLQKHGREKALEYIETVEQNASDAVIAPALWVAIELFTLFTLLYFITFWPASNTVTKAKQDAAKFLATANKVNCIKSPNEDCKTFAVILINDKTMATKNNHPVQTKTVVGHIVSSSAKEWAIYQPPYVTKTKQGKLRLIKRANIIEVEHDI